MDLCQREQLHQVDLLSPAEKKITDRGRLYRRTDIPCLLPCFLLHQPHVLPVHDKRQEGHGDQERGRNNKDHAPLYFSSHKISYSLMR